MKDDPDALTWTATSLTSPRQTSPRQTSPRHQDSLKEREPMDPVFKEPFHFFFFYHKVRNMKLHKAKEVVRVSDNSEAIVWWMDFRRCNLVVAHS